ncbi:MAG: hypothetical protein HAW62_01235, partial [Endozoicomonadaceae bacterium]|nr:hypothetical protein [Endozoicomonadaceae bacterium]
TLPKLIYFIKKKLNQSNLDKTQINTLREKLNELQFLFQFMIKSKSTEEYIKILRIISHTNPLSLDSSQQDPLQQFQAWLQSITQGLTSQDIDVVTIQASLQRTKKISDHIQQKKYTHQYALNRQSQVHQTHTELSPLDFSTYLTLVEGSLHTPELKQHHTQLSWIAQEGKKIYLQQSSPDHKKKYDILLQSAANFIINPQSKKNGINYKEHYQSYQQYEKMRQQKLDYLQKEVLLSFKLIQSCLLKYSTTSTPDQIKKIAQQITSLEQNHRALKLKKIDYYQYIIELQGIISSIPANDISSKEFFFKSSNVTEIRRAFKYYLNHQDTHNTRRKSQLSKDNDAQDYMSILQKNLESLRRHSLQYI